MDASQEVQAIQIIALRTAIPIHSSDYPVFKLLLEDFVKAIAAAGLEQKVRMVVLNCLLLLAR